MDNLLKELESYVKGTVNILTKLESLGKQLVLHESNPEIRDIGQEILDIIEEENE